MQALGILQLQHPSLRADVIMYSSVLSAATSEWKNGLQGVAAMTWRCLQVDVVACNSLLNAMRGGCGGGAGWQAISNRLVAFQRLGLKFTTVTVNVVTNGLAESGQWRWAMHALGTVRQASLQDNLAIYGSAVHACAASWVRASQLLQTLRQSPIEANTIVLGAATTACGKDQRWTQSTHLLSELRSNALRVSTVAQNAVLSCCGQAQLWRLALAFWSTALGHGLELDDVSSGAVIKASGYWGVAVQHLNLSRQRTLQTGPQYRATTIARMPDRIACASHIRRQFLRAGAKDGDHHTQHSFGLHGRSHALDWCPFPPTPFRACHATNGCSIRQHHHQPLAQLSRGFSRFFP